LNNIYGLLCLSIGIINIIDFAYSFLDLTFDELPIRLNNVCYKFFWIILSWNDLYF